MTDPRRRVAGVLTVIEVGHRGRAQAGWTPRKRQRAAISVGAVARCVMQTWRVMGVCSDAVSALWLARSIDLPFHDVTLAWHLHLLIYFVCYLSL